MGLMKVRLTRVNDAYGMQATNEDGQHMLFDANPSIGGQGLGLRPMEVLAASVAACASIDVLLILKKKRIALRKYEIEIEGQRKEATPAPFVSIHLRVEIHPEDPLETVEKVVAMSLEKYCSVSASLDPAIPVTFEVTAVA
jgi:putative redox protein